MKEKIKTFCFSCSKIALVLFISVGFIASGAFLLWAATLTMPSLESVEQRRIEQSTKIYDKTGKILLYDLHQDIKRTVIGFDEMSPYIKDATIAIEDEEFYEHYGIKPTAILRAVWANVVSGGFVQGGSTITQQVVKNSVLVSDKTISRKFKEWVLAIKLEQELSKDKILELYLNEAPYGGNKYGIEEASRAFFDKDANELTLAEAAYLAALPQAPTYFSPYGNHREDLEARKNKVLSKMLEHGFIGEEEYAAAGEEEVTFQPQRDTGIEAPHFVFYVIDELREVYSEREIQEGGLRVITTLDHELQTQAEEIVNRYALENSEKFNASNASLVAIDPQTGGIIVMVGSRDYFDEDIDGNFNIALAHRQPGSSFKPFVYAAAVEKGYTPETVVFDVRTQFSTACEPTDLTSEEGCYSPGNYDNRFRGPMTFRNALAQSVNVPAVKAMYLAGTRNSLDLAKRLGVRSLANNIDQYGLSLVLGGGEVTLLEMVSAYGVFASDGIRREQSSLIRIEDRDGNVLKSFDTTLGRKVIDENVARAVNDMLSDNIARTPAFGSRSHLYFPDRQVAAKTGTTNEYRDAWIIGYTPEIVAGAWAGNNDNTPMDKKVAGFIIAPLWNEFMQAAFETYATSTNFTAYQKPEGDLKPVLRGVWQGSTYTIDTTTGNLATKNTPLEFRQEVSTGNIHSILHWLNKDDPNGTYPDNPAADGQYEYWEYGVKLWKAINGYGIATSTSSNIPEAPSTTHNPENAPIVTIKHPDNGDEFDKNDRVNIRLDIEEKEYPIKKVDFFVNGEYVGTSGSQPFRYSFRPEDIDAIKRYNRLQVVAHDEVSNKGTATLNFEVDK